MHVALCILAGFGLANALVIEEITKPVRMVAFRVPFVRKLFACRPCMGFWTGSGCALTLFWEEWVLVVLIGLATHGVCKVVNLLDK